MMREDETHEFKRIWTPDVCKEIVAFANTSGGTVYVGVDDDGTILGLENQEEEYTRITNSIRDSIEPDAAMLVRCSANDDDTIHIVVSEGSNKPYCLRAKGCNPKGVFVRQGSTSVPATMEQIRRLIRDSEGQPFERLTSLCQALTFDQAAAAFQQAQEDFGPDKYQQLGIVRPGTDIFTNTGLLLSDQCGHTVKIAVFEDDAKTVFHDRREFSGSIIGQFDAAFAFLDWNNATRAEISGARRIERSDYPSAAIREALVNALIHRAYSFSASIIVNVSRQEMEFISLGGIPADLTIHDITNGVSVPRNRDLAEVFHRLHLIEGYGTGLRRIMELYTDVQVKPSITATANTFRIVLPNRNAAFSELENPEVMNDALRPAGNARLSPDLCAVLSYAAAHESITAAHVGELLGCGKTRAYTILRSMKDEGLLQPVPGQRGQYTAVSKPN